MTSNKHFPNAIYANCNAKPEKFFTCSGQHLLLSINESMVPYHKNFPIKQYIYPK